MPSPLSSRAPVRARPAATTAVKLSTKSLPRPPLEPFPDRRRRAAASRGVTLLALLGLLALAGCKLVDQTTFAPAPAAAPTAAASPRATPVTKINVRAPLLTVGPDTPVSGYRPLLSFAVRTAERRDRNVRFDVTAVAPAHLAPARQTAETDAAEAQATQVMRAIVQAGVPPDRILLHVVLDPATTRHAVRVYVR